MKLFEIIHRPLYHFTRVKMYSELKDKGFIKIDKTFFSMTKAPHKIEGHFGEILLEVDIQKLEKRGVKLLEIIYELPWLEEHGLLRYVTGYNNDYWQDWVEQEYPDVISQKKSSYLKAAERIKVINNEINELYGFESEVVAVDMEKLYLEETKLCQ